MQTNVLEYMDQTVKRLPDKIAFTTGNKQDEITFAMLEQIHKSVGTYLIQQGYCREPVVVFMEKHPKTILAFFAVIASGNFYIPIDAEMPRARMELIFDNVKPRAIICDAVTIESVKKMEGVTKYQCSIYLFDDMMNTPILEEALLNRRMQALDTDPIYVVFTSGSTGVPKGVVACHRSVIDYIEQLSAVLAFSEDTIFANQTPLYFDACLKELYPTLKYGATTVIVPKSLFMFPVKLVDFLNEHRVNTVCWVVSALTMISAFKTFDKVKPQYLHTIAFGSEVFPIKQFKLWKEVLPDARFVNLYGPTEGTGMCCYYEVNRDFALDESIPIGRPFRNTEILLLSDDNTQSKQGEPGEICIRGTSVTLGYYNNPEKTAEAFVQNPLNSAYPEIIYRTGDIGRYNEFQELVFVSRKDYQIKHMGHRIELGEIEVNTNLLEGVKISGCIYDNDKGKIVLFYVGEITAGTLLAELKDRVPRYMVPNQVVALDAMPFTANGKIDRVQLKNMYQQEKEKR